MLEHVLIHLALNPMCTQKTDTETISLGEIMDLVDATFEPLSITRRSFNHSAGELYRFDRSARVAASFEHYWVNKCNQCPPLKAQTHNLWRSNNDTEACDCGKPKTFKEQLAEKYSTGLGRIAYLESLRDAQRKTICSHIETIANLQKVNEALCQENGTLKTRLDNQRLSIESLIAERNELRDKLHNYDTAWANGKDDAGVKFFWLAIDLARALKCHIDDARWSANHSTLIEKAEKLGLKL